MAGQANITEILAALAAQRPGGTPSQSQIPPQQAPPQGYTASPYPGAGPPSASSYSLPQPSSAGHVDLSTIKPSNAGSVSFQDTLAKARGFAAERGVSYESPRPGRYSQPKAHNLEGEHSLIYNVDARLPARPPPHQRQRSRSRSPPRVRDNFRDNYNPYRDERRDDSRRFNGPGPYTRDRSYSPGPGSRQGAVFSPQGYNRGTGGEEDEDSEIIFIDSNVVGLIIGKGGENMRRIEQETSTRVQFISGPDSSAPKRQCKIKGTRAARQHAKDEINRVIEENGNPARGNLPPSRLSDANRTGGGGTHQPALRAGEDATQIMVPNRTVGLIIGRGGETIRDLQEKSQCHINIVGPEKAVNGLRPVNLIGTPANAKAAKEAIMEIVELDTKASSNGEGGRDQGGRGQGGGANFGNFGGGGGEERINDSMIVPSGAVGMIIGKGGETIKDMQMSTGCKINVAQPVGVDHERSIGLVGSRGSIEAAKRAIMEKVHAVQEKSGDHDRDRFGGGGGGPNRRENNSNYQDPYSQSQQQQQHYPPYGQQQNSGYQQSQQDQQQQAQQQMPQQGTADQYAPWGGYENYARMYYAYMNQQAAQQQGGTPAGAGPSGPPPSG